MNDQASFPGQGKKPRFLFYGTHGRTQSLSACCGKYS